MSRLSVYDPFAEVFPELFRGLVSPARAQAGQGLEVRVEVTPLVFSDEVRALESLRSEIQSKIKQLIGLSAKVTLVEPGHIERSTGKAKRVLDLRKK